MKTISIEAYQSATHGTDPYVPLPVFEKRPHAHVGEALLLRVVDEFVSIKMTQPLARPDPENALPVADYGGDIVVDQTVCRGKVAKSLSIEPI